MYKYPLINKYLKDIIKRRKSLPYSNKSFLLSYINDEPNEIEKLLRKIQVIKNFKDIFKIVEELNTKNDPDERIGDMWAELKGAFFLKRNDFSKIVYNKKSFDFTASKETKVFAIEIEFIRGPNFKGQKNVDGAFLLNSNIETNRIKDKINHALKQLGKHNNRIIVLISDKSDYTLKDTYFLKEIENYINGENRVKIYLITISGEVLCN